MKNLLAQNAHVLPGTINGEGPYGNPGGAAPSMFVSIISAIIGLMTLIAGVYFFFILVTGAIAWISAGGNKGAVEAARQRIFNGLIGIVIVVASIFIVQIVGNLVGFPYILDPGSAIYQLTPGSDGGVPWHSCEWDGTSCAQGTSCPAGYVPELPCAGRSHVACLELGYPCRLE